MKRTIFICICMYSLLMAMDFSFEQPIEYGTRNNSTLLVSDNRLINCASGWIELYAIEPDGSLCLLDRLQNDLMIASSQLFDDMIYVADTVWENYSRIRAVSFTGDVLTVQNSIIVPHEEIGDAVGVIRVNDEYLFYVTYSSNGYSIILDRQTFNQVGSMQTGGYFFLYQNYFIVELTNYIECMVQIEDISDIAHPDTISHCLIGPYERFYTYKIYGDTLIIAKETGVSILSIADISSPVIIGTIDNLPNIQNVMVPGLFDVEKWGDNLIITEYEGSIWVYDISDVNNPVLVTYSDEIMDYGHGVQPLALWESSLYVTGDCYPIMQFDCNSFPSFSQTGSFGNLTFFQSDALMDNWYIYTSAHEDIRYCKKDAPVLEARCKEIPGRVVKMCVTGSELYGFEFYDADNYADTLYVIEDAGSDLEISRKIDVSSLFIKDAYFIEPYFACITHTTDQLDFYQLTDTGLDLIQSGVGSDFICFHKQPENLNYLYCLNDDRDIVRIQKEPPFSILGTGDLAGLGPCPIIFVTSDDRGVVWGEIGAPISTVSLVALDDAMNVTVLDQMQTQCDGAVNVNGDIVYMLPFLGHEVQFYHYQNDEFDLFYEYDFERIIGRVTFDPQNETVYCLGLFNAERYTYTPTAADPQLVPPPAVTLSNYPNPFNPETTISFETTNAHESAQIEIFNAKGQKVKQLQMTNDELRAGSVHWDGTDSANQPVTSGVYLYQLKAGGKTLGQKKCLLLK